MLHRGIMHICTLTPHEFKEYCVPISVFGHEDLIGLSPVEETMSAFDTKCACGCGLNLRVVVWRWTKLSTRQFAERECAIRQKAKETATVEKMTNEALATYHRRGPEYSDLPAWHRSSS